MYSCAPFTCGDGGGIRARGHQKKLSNFMRMFGNFFYTFLDVFCFTFCLDLLVSFVALFSLTNERGLSSARAPMLADDFFASNEYTEYSEHRTPSKYFLVMNISFPCCSSLLLRCWRACFSNVRNSFFVSSHLRWLLAVGCSCWSWSWTYLVNATAHLYSNYGRCFTLTRRKTEDFILINAAAFLVPKSSRHNFESE